MDRLLSMRVFERVVDEGSFAGAARVLDLSAPVVTRLVADLEDHLGTRLLQRSTRRLALTEAGQDYLNRVRSILQDIDEAHAATTASTQELAGLLRVHASPVLASHLVAPLLAGFHERYPRIRIDIEVDNGGDPAIEQFDITLIPTDDGFDGDVVARRVLDSHAVLVASPAYVRRRGLPRTPQELPQHDCLRVKPPQGRARSWRLLAEDGSMPAVDLEIEPVLAANHTDTLLRAAMDGVGITSAAVDLVAPALSDGSLVRVLAPWITGRLAIYAALPSRKFVPQRTRAFLDYLVEKSRAQATQALAVCAQC
ncbi:MULTISPECIES: LysR family transcriptional regulator [Ramlibacter]|uniref:LysR family transcriptional regulator n=1 Tax=Ramlibacter aquaticus TaxID=2780094 RepID=A0ABR9SE77_9BURK|nr:MULTISPECIES: LysR family transcriptional regulator [Ramlibacter]MBE7940658.1 LysR family transcriptional regulator [Ramlibacter aquaticus]